VIVREEEKECSQEKRRKGDSKGDSKGRGERVIVREEEEG